MERAPESAAASSRSVLYIGVGVAALVVLAVLIVVLVAPRSPATFAEGSPEAAFQRYLLSVEDGDYPAAYELFSQEVRDEMSLRQYERNASGYGAPYGPGVSRRILFDRTSGGGDRATLHLTVEEFYAGGPFGGGDTYRSSRQVRMVREGGEWRIDEALFGLEPAAPHGEY
jgi:hypothetical protein